MATPKWYAKASQAAYDEITTRWPTAMQTKSIHGDYEATEYYMVNDEHNHTKLIHVDIYKMPGNSVHYALYERILLTSKKAS